MFECSQFRLEASARPVPHGPDSPLVPRARQLLTQSGALAQLRPPCSQHFRSSPVTHVGDISYPAIRSSASTHPQARPALADPLKVSSRRGACSRRRGMCSRRGSTLPPTLPSQLAGGTCLLSSELLTSTCSALCSLHSRRPHSQPPPAAACLHPPAASVPSGAVPSGAVSRWLARDGGARDGARSVHRWWSRRTTRRSTLLTALACAESRPSLAVGSRLAVESNQYLATIEIVAAERLARGGCIL